MKGKLAALIEGVLVPELNAGGVGEATGVIVEVPEYRIWKSSNNFKQRTDYTEEKL